MSASQLLSRRQAFALAAWAFVGAGCDAPTSEPPQASASGGAAAPVGPPKLGDGLSDLTARQFYELRGGKRAWTEREAAALKRSFDEARRHGLDPRAFAVKQAAADDPDQQDVALTLAALRYARALAFGFVDPKRIEKIFTLEGNQVDLAAGLHQALDKQDLPGWLASLPPSDAEYRALSAAYQAAVGTTRVSSAPERVARCQSPPDQTAPDQSAPAQPAPGQTVPSPKAPDQGAPAQSGPGQSGPGQSGPAQGTPANQSAPGTRGAPESAPAQAAPAQPPSNQTQSAPVVGAQPAPAPAAPAGASVSPADRVRQLAANLERRRWLNRAPAATRIDVNTASCTLVYLKEGTDPWAARIVCGKVGHESPSIQAAFHRLIANPAWRVPMGIARKEIFPKGRGYMRREHMHVVDGQVVQRPGPRNSLGVVKFDVEDPYQIYLHDTPSKSLFAAPERHKSHGCVRVQNAVELARLIAGQTGKTDAFDKALASGKTGEVDIGQPIPVRLLYHTAFADSSGRITFVPDVYGWNDKLATALGLGPAPSGAQREEPDVDIGP